MCALSTKFSVFNANNKHLSKAMYRAQTFGAQYECTRPREKGNNLDNEEHVDFIPQWVWFSLVGHWNLLAFRKGVKNS